MNKTIRLTIALILSFLLNSIAFSSKEREIIKAYEKGKPAKMDIEITKVRSDNFIEFYINKNEKKIYRDITQRTREVEDLDKKLYVTTYLKPNTKSNTIHDELEHKIIDSDGKRYLEISYSKEPEKIYLWVVKNDKVEKLYTGILKEIITSTRADYNYSADSKVLSFNNKFVFSLSGNSTTPSLSDNLHNGSGKIGAWNSSQGASKNGSVQPYITLKNQIDGSTSTFEGEILSLKNFNGTKTFSFPHLDLEYYTDYNSLGISINFKNYNFQEITVKFNYYTGASNNIKGTDIITINFAEFEVSATDLNFGEFHKSEGATAVSDIKILNPNNLSFELSIPNKQYYISNMADSSIQLPIYVELVDESKISGVIEKATSGNEYIEGAYSGTIPLTITLISNKRGGRF